MLDVFLHQLTKRLPRGAHRRLKFDESRRLPQNHSMKRTGILSVLFAAAAAVAAQSSGEFTPVPPPSNPQSQAGAQPVPPPRMPSPPADAGTNAPAAAGTNAPMGGRMSLLDCIQATLAHNFDVQIERYNPQISLYNLNAAYSGYDPSFTASGQHDYSVSGGGLNQNHQPIPASVSDGNSFRTGLGGLLPLGLQYNLTGSASDTYGASGVSGFENSSSSAQVSLTQPLLKNFWIDSTRLNIRVAKNRLKYSEQGLRQQLITSVTAVANAYYELIYAQQNVQVQQQALDLAQTQLNQDNQRVQIGTLAVLSVQQDESQAAQSKANLIAAQSTLDTDQNALKNLLTDNYSQWHDTDIQPAETLIAPPRTFDLQDSWTKGMAKRPDLLQAKLNVEQQGIQLKYDRNQLFPQLDLIGSFGYTGAGREFDPALDQTGEGNRPAYTYGAQLTVPLGNVGPRNQYRTAKATMQQVGLRLKQLEQNVMVQIDNAVKQAESARQSAEATKQARIYAESALDAETKTYAVGKATTFEVLTYQNNLTAARSQEIRALANYNEALSNLAQQEGTTLERYNINLEVK
jgi:HAE1 family hydrophobic/amphiphilic exporter-1